MQFGSVTLANQTTAPQRSASIQQQAEGRAALAAVSILSVGCRVSRVASLPSTPDTDTIALCDNIREGWRQHPGGVTTTFGRGSDNIWEG